MADVFSRAKRSQVMSRIKSRGNRATELELLALLRRHHVSGWRRGATSIFGSPDFTFPRFRVAIFVDGCFWHTCPRHKSIPANNRAFWLAKLARNRARDRLVTRTLRKQGWGVLRVWQHELSVRNEKRLLRRIQRALTETQGAGRRRKLPKKRRQDRASYLGQHRISVDFA